MIYIGIFMILVIAATINFYTDYKYKKFSQYIFIVMGIIIFLLAALRNGIGYDFNSYKNIFEAIKNGIPGVDLNFEIGYLLINKFSFSFEMLIFIVAVIGVGIKLMYIYKYSEDKIITLLMYFTGIFIMFDMGVIRQGMSISLGFLSIKYIKNRDFKKFFLTILVGSMFHVSILIFIPLYFIGDKIFTRKQIYSAVIIVLIISIFDTRQLMINIFSTIDIPIVSSKILYYANIDTGNITLSIIKRIIYLVLFIELYSKYNITDNYSKIYLNGYILSVVFMGLFSSIDIIGGRGVMGLYALQIMIFATIFKRMNNKKYRFILLAVISLMSYNTMMGPINHGNISNQPYSPYRCIFNK